MKKVKDNREKEVVYMTREEVEDVKVNILTSGRGYNFHDPWIHRDYALFMLGCSTGLRNSAIHEINVEDLDLARREVTVTEKNDVTKPVYLGKNTCDALAGWLDVRKMLLDKRGAISDALFISNQMHRITDVTLARVLKKYTADLGKHITPHKMRSTCAMNLYEASGDIYLVAQQLGHKSIRNTAIYARATEKRLREAVDVLDGII